MFKFNKAKLLPLVMKLGDFLKEGFDQYVTLKASGLHPDADVLAAFILIKMDPWDPKMAGKTLFDDDTKEACARFLGGVAYNLAK
jgi:hypothetical protein